MRVLAYTISRADTAARGRLLLDTLTMGRDTAGADFDWMLMCNSPLALSIGKSALATRVITELHHYDCNVGQHVPSNEAIAAALAGNYDFLLRLDDDIEFKSKRWLAKLLQAAKDLKDPMLISPTILGLNHPPDLTEPLSVNGVPVRFSLQHMGGICRLAPVSLLRDKPYESDVRLPMGLGDASGVGKWAETNIVPMAYLLHVRIRHAKGTTGQRESDPEYHSMHPIYQTIPYIPAWSPSCE